MRGGFLLALMLLLPGVFLPVPVQADERLVFGSFRNPQNAGNWASRMRMLLNVDIQVLAAASGTGSPTYRVVTGELDAAAATRVRRLADARQLSYWRLLDLEAANAAPAALGERTHAGQRSGEVETGGGTAVAAGTVRSVPAPVRLPNPKRPPTPATQPPVRPVETIRPVAAPRDSVVQMLDLDVGAQARTFFQDGLDGQSRFHPSLSLQFDYYRAWDEERQTFTFSPFYRYDAEDDERTHFDIREAYWSLVGDDWDLHLGVKQIFWGVIEFNHLVDIINQTDLVENIDEEDKLGQPMAHLSLVRNWGILDLLVLPGFRERTFPGVNGRPRYFVPIDTDNARYESSAGDRRVDGAIRWSHHIGAFEFGLYHFNGTSRAPLFDVLTDSQGETFLRPFYPVIDQTGLDAQAIYGDWAFKLEAIRRTNFPTTFYSYNAGLERTLVGVFGTRADLGLVVEYLYDDRGDLAFDTFYENDLAIATRWAFNDLGDTQALIGVIWDHKTDETILSLEASRRLGETWTLLVEGRAFAGAGRLNPLDPFDPVNKGASVTRDAYIELELTKYF